VTKGGGCRGRWRIRCESKPDEANNVLTVLSSLLKKGVEWGELERLPCVIKLLPNPRRMGFQDFDEYDWLLMVARQRGPDTYLMVLVVGNAGLRLGEIIALEWRDIDMAARRLTVERSDWLGHVNVPKGGRSRQLPMTQRLKIAVKAVRHLRGERVLCLPDGSPIPRDRVIKAVRGAQRIAGIEQGVYLAAHVLFRLRARRYGGHVAFNHSHREKRTSDSERATGAERGSQGPPQRLCKGSADEVPRPRFE
jgi:integrase